MNMKPTKPTAIKIEPVKKLSQSNIQGQVESICNNNIVGWVQYKDDISKTVEIDVYDGDAYLEISKKLRSLK